MIEITPILTTHPIKKINKIVREREEQPADQNQPEQQKRDEETNASDDSEQQHIDEIV